VAVFDGTISTLTGPQIPTNPVRIAFRDGFVEAIEGGEEARIVEQTIAEGEAMGRKVGNEVEVRNCRHLGEFGIGINDKAQITGVIIEDEKALKTCHFALGSNYDFDAPAIIHRDMLIMNPSVWIDDDQIMKNGDLLL
jgi:leucyl aminopeptidase (aminopeptidase T)